MIKLVAIQRDGSLAEEGGTLSGAQANEQSKGDHQLPENPFVVDAATRG